jgi:hypothetical protein
LIAITPLEWRAPHSFAAHALSLTTMMQVQLQFQWGEKSRQNCDPVNGSPSSGGVLPHLSDPVHAASAATPTAARIELPATTTESGGPPLFPPLAAAIECGVFGVTETGPIEPNEEDVASLTVEHSNEMIALLADLAAVEDGLRTGRNPRTGKLPRTPETRARLAPRLQTERARLQEAYADAFAVYAEAFGEEAAAALDVWVRREGANTLSQWTTCAGQVFRVSGR